MRTFRSDQEPLALEVNFFTVDGGVIVTAEGASQSSAEPVALTTAEIARLAEQGDAFRRGHIQEEEAARKIGYFLFGRVFRDDIKEIFLESKAIAWERGGPLRIVLAFPSTSIIQEVPWELLHDGANFLARHPWSTIVRRIRLRQPAPDLSVEPPLRVLFTACGAMFGSQGGLNLEQEVQTFRAAMANAGGLVQVEVAVGGPKGGPLTLQRLEGLFRRARARDRPYHVWHHAGHGGLTRGSAGPEFCLLLENERREAAPILARQVSHSVADASDLKLAVLNLCFSGSTIGLSTELARLNVPAVIGFCGSVVDPAAIELTRTLYRGLAELPLDLLLTEARNAMTDRKWPLEWALPVLICRSRGHLLLLRKKLDPKKRVVMGGYPSSARIQVGGDRIRAKRLMQVGVIGTSDRTEDLEVALNPSRVEVDDLLQIGRVGGEGASKDFQEQFQELWKGLEYLRGESEEES